MAGAWASLVERATAPIQAASPYPRDVAGGTSANVQWTVNTSAAHSINAAWPVSSQVTEQTAMSVPAFSHGVNVIAGTCSGLPQWVHRGRFETVQPTPPIIAQPDPDLPTSIHWRSVFVDLILRPYSWCVVTRRLANGFPMSMRHVPHTDISVAKEGIYIDGVRVDERDVIRFDSPVSPGALTNGSRILATAIMIEEAVRRFANFDVPSGVLKQTGGPDLLDSEIDDLLAGWEAARQSRSTAFLNQSLDYKSNAFDARQLQLVEAREAVTKDIARLLALPPSTINADSGGGLTYSTVEMQQEALQSQTLWPYLTAVRQRMSMDDILPHGTFVEYPSLALMRTDLTGRAQAYQTLLSNGVLTVEEVRTFEQLPPLPATGGSNLP